MVIATIRFPGCGVKGSGKNGVLLLPNPNPIQRNVTVRLIVYSSSSYTLSLFLLLSQLLDLS